MTVKDAGDRTVAAQASRGWSAGLHSPTGACMFKRGGRKAAPSMLKRHLMPDRKLAVDHHRQKWGFRSGYPVVSPDDAKTQFALAMKIGAMKIGAMKMGLGRKGPAAQKKAARRR